MQSTKPTGKLQVVVREANLTRDTEVFSKMDPYCTVRCGSQ